MYLQVPVPHKDRNALHFLWLEQGCFVEYHMTSHLFGGVCYSSSSTSLFARLTDLLSNDFITKTVLHDFYIDNILKSVAAAAEERCVIHKAKHVINRVRFNLFVVNDIGSKYRRAKEPLGLNLCYQKCTAGR